VQQFLSLVFVASLIGVFALPVLADSGAGMSGMSVRHTQQGCSTGQTWVKGYKKKNGSLVKGYCRKPVAKR
jgi:hypothetical protein